MRRALLALAVLVSASLPAAAATVTHQLTSDFGPVTLTVNTSTGEVKGTYPSYKGRIVARLIDRGDTISGVWVQPTSEQRCSTQSNGSWYWGRIVFPKPSGGTIRGKWSFCDRAPTEAWNAWIR